MAEGVQPCAKQVLIGPAARGSSSTFRRKLRYVGGMPHRDLSRSLGTLDTLIEMLQVYVLSSLG